LNFNEKFTHATSVQEEQEAKGALRAKHPNPPTFLTVHILHYCHFVHYVPVTSVGGLSRARSCGYDLVGCGQTRFCSGHWQA